MGKTPNPTPAKYAGTKPARSLPSASAANVVVGLLLRGVRVFQVVPVAGSRKAALDSLLTHLTQFCHTPVLRLRYAAGTLRSGGRCLGRPQRK
jgi:hypothetical protein